MHSELKTLNPPDARLAESEYYEYDEHYHEATYEDEAVNYAHFEEDDFYEEDIDLTHSSTGAQRVMRLLLILVVVAIVTLVMLFGVLPFIETLTQPALPNLPPAVQT